MRSRQAAHAQYPSKQARFGWLKLLSTSSSRPSWRRQPRRGRRSAAAARKSTPFYFPNPKNLALRGEFGSSAPVTFRRRLTAVASSSRRASANQGHPWRPPPPNACSSCCSPSSSTGKLRPAGRIAPGAMVDLSHNALSGRVPPELATAGAVYLNGNRFAGEVPREVTAAAEAGRMRVPFAVCAHWNCAAPPPAVVAACPAKGGRGRRPEGMSS
ncbi:leucine-rich repeat receptor-like protein FASCIATED EAR2 [Panicum miliaceum]|uniref:Leucine-rich repeat receptor-like protein FASCIATED EAR2 n=1 Tax=Panicum miliaceum TaxID=4540 RepID=A0A3L6RN27_PANMI|nr:leucine-rich repeat receptor-like protein FASCIATED EAR2 [Panicum miliaceum]